MTNSGDSEGGHAAGDLTGAQARLALAGGAPIYWKRAREMPEQPNIGYGATIGERSDLGASVHAASLFRHLQLSLAEAEERDWIERGPQDRQPLRQ
jgi:hypothetical protein